jgi:radical SAM superfamily enzyme YgiQ (UPF0313 family)
MKNILLLRTYTEILGRSINPSLGLMYIASSAREHGKKHGSDFQFKILDLNLYSQKIEDRMAEIREFSPQVVGITGMSFEAATMHETAAYLKKNLPGVRIIFGGPHATVSTHKSIQDPNVDFVVIGEGEDTFPELLDQIFSGSGQYGNVRGIAYRNGTETVVTGKREYRQDLDNIPFPAWDLIDMEGYFDAPRWQFIHAERRYMPIFTSRACPYQCVYCHHIFGKQFRYRSPENVFREIKLLHDQYGIREFLIADDMFNALIKRAVAICDLIIQSGIKIYITFPNGVRGDVMTDELLLKLKQAGTYKIVYAIETASPRLQKLIKKNIDLVKLKSVIEKTNKLGLIVHGFFMLGFPTETLEEVMETVKYALSSKLHIGGFFFVDPFEGTELSEWVRSIRPDLMDSGHHDFFSAKRQLSEVPTAKLEKIQRDLYKKFYFNPGRVLSLLMRLPKKKLVLTLPGIWFTMAFKAFRPKKKTVSSQDAQAKEAFAEGCVTQK